MSDFKHILFPVDFSDRCFAVRPLVKSTAQQFNTRLTLMHVIQIPIGWYGGMEAAFPVMFDVPEMKKAAVTQLNTFFESSELSELPQIVIEHGEPAAKITAYVEQSDVDLIMMPTHGYGKFRSLLLGSVTAKVLHDAKCTVWTDAPTNGAKLENRLNCQSILCAIDLVPESVELIHYAADLAREYKATLRLVHAISATEALPDRNLDTEFRQFLFQVNREEIAKLQREANTNLEVCMEGGGVSAVVCAAARHHKADLLVIGRGRLYETLGRLRTNSYAIIRDSPCPVMSV